MNVNRIKNPDGNGFHTIAEGSDFEFVNPLEKIRELYVTTNVIFDENILILQAEKNEELKELMKNRKMAMYVLYEKAFKEWEEEKKIILSTEVPTALFQVLNSNSKNNQEKILRGLSITNKELTAFICQAGEKFDYKYSLYKSEHYSKGLDESKFPSLFYTDEKSGKVVSIGTSSLSEGQLKQAIDHRKAVVAKFLDKDETWHCFFFTYRSLKGEEKSWNNGQPHLHYISDKWGIKRTELIQRLKSRDIPSSKIHIDFHTHRNTKEK